MITAVHTLIYSSDPEATRAFLRDVLEWPSVDAGGGWLIFKTGKSELGVHPGSAEPDDGRNHEITLICDDLEKTMAELSLKGAEFDGGIEERRFGRAAQLTVPGAGRLLVYEPQHPTAYDI